MECLIIVSLHSFNDYDVCILYIVLDLSHIIPMNKGTLGEVFRYVWNHVDTEAVANKTQLLLICTI